MLPALAGLVVGLAYAAISVYWAVGGTWLLDTVGISLSHPGQVGRTAALLTVWAAAVVKAIAAVLPVLAVRGGGADPRAADRGPRRVAILVVYGLILTATGLLVQAGLIRASANANHLALKWHAYLWDPWFLVWGILVAVAQWRSRPTTPEHADQAAEAAPGVSH